MINTAPLNSHTSVPFAALTWGWAGIIPFVASSYASVFADEIWKQYSLQIITQYGAIILTFMGGVHWGILLNKLKTSSWLYSTGIMPSLFAVVTILLPPLYAIPVLVIGLITVLICDLCFVNLKIMPIWYGRLRIQLTLVAVVCLLVALAGTFY
ncbi:MAG: hypothetical protein TECD_00820 [Hyphomicrobiaceae bacterium hypho_1]